MEESKDEKLVRIPKEFNVDKYEIKMHPKMRELKFDAEVTITVTVKDYDIDALRLHMQNIEVQRIEVYHQDINLTGVRCEQDPDYIQNTYFIMFDGNFERNKKYIVKIKYSGII